MTNALEHDTSGDPRKFDLCDDAVCINCGDGITVYIDRSIPGEIIVSSWRESDPNELAKTVIYDT